MINLVLRLLSWIPFVRRYRTSRFIRVCILKQLARESVAPHLLRYRGPRVAKAMREADAAEDVAGHALFGKPGGGFPA